MSDSNLAGLLEALVALDPPPSSDELILELARRGLKVVPVEAEVTYPDGTVRKVHYGEGKQPWDVMVEIGLAPAFAAGSVLKYLRRTKDPEDSLKKARWYYRELHSLWRDPSYDVVLGKLLDALTEAELEILDPLVASLRSTIYD